MKSYEEKESFPIEEEQDLSPIAEAMPVEDPAVTKTHKKAAVGLTIPSVILLCSSLVLFAFAFLMQSLAKDALTSGNVAEAFFGGLFILIPFFLSAGGCCITSAITLGLSIGLLCNNAKKKLHIWYPILFLSLSVCFIGGLIPLIATLHL